MDKLELGRSSTALQTYSAPVNSKKNSIIGIFSFTLSLIGLGGVLILGAVFGVLEEMNPSFDESNSTFILMGLLIWCFIVILFIALILGLVGTIFNSSNKKRELAIAGLVTSSVFTLLILLVSC